MSRPLRIQYPDAWYHVLNSGRRGEKIFLGKNDCKTFISLLNDLSPNYNVNIAAYCLMSNHYHLLIQTPEANISRSMRHLNGVYTQRYNRFHHLDGPLFKGRYKCILVDGDTYLLELIRYIHRNPLEAGMVDNLEKYDWSSHKWYISNAKKWEWLFKNYILSLFSKNKAESIRRYEHFVSKKIPEEINHILGRRNLPAVIGKESFIDKIKQKYFINKTHEEIPASKSLAPDVDKIVNEVCKYYRVTTNEILLSRRGYFNEPRNVAIYLIRHLRGETLKGVGAFFGINRNSTISSIDRRLKREMIRDKRIKKNIENLKFILSKGQE